MLNYEMKRRLAVLSENQKTGWTKELNLVSWNGAPAKYDIREFSPDRQKLSKGIVLTKEEMERIKDVILSGII